MEIYNIMRIVTWKIYMQLSFDVSVASFVSSVSYELVSHVDYIINKA